MTLGLTAAVRVQQHQVGDARWETAVRQPHLRLAPLLVGPYTGWVEHHTPAVVRRELPFPGLPLILNLGPAFRLTDSRTGISSAHRSFVAGLDDWYTGSESPNGACGVQVNLTPLGARRILGLPLHLLTRRIVSLTDLLGADGGMLEARVAAEQSWEGRFAQLEQWLLARLDRAAEPSAGVAWMWGQMHHAGGQVEVGRLSAELGWSRRRVVAEFREEVGLAPKLIARIIRFDRMVGRLRRGTAPSWTALAYESGYHDQAHLIREVRGFAGCTPTDLPGHLLPIADPPG